MGAAVAQDVARAVLKHVAASPVGFVQTWLAWHRDEVRTLDADATGRALVRAHYEEFVVQCGEPFMRGLVPFDYDMHRPLLVDGRAHLCIVVHEPSEHWFAAAELQYYCSGWLGRWPPAYDDFMSLDVLCNRHIDEVVLPVPGRWVYQVTREDLKEGRVFVQGTLHPERYRASTTAPGVSESVFKGRMFVRFVIVVP